MSRGLDLSLARLPISKSMREKSWHCITGLAPENVLVQFSQFLLFFESRFLVLETPARCQTDRVSLQKQSEQL